MTAFALTLVVLSGGGVAALWALYRWGWRAGPLALGAIGLAPALGYGALSLATFAWAWSGRPGGRLALIALASVLSAGLVWLTPRRPPLPRRQCEPLPRGLIRAIVVAAALALAAVALASPALSRAQPLGRYDAHAIWNAHAAFLFRAEDELPQRFRRMERGHPDYPLFVPAAVAGQWSLLGQESAVIPQAMGAILLLATAVVVGAALAALGCPVAGCLALTLYLSTPNALRWGFGQCADVPLSYLFVAAAVGCAGLLGAKPGAPLPPSLTGFLLGLLAWTKNEGMMLAALLVGVLAVCWTGLRLRPRQGSSGYPSRDHLGLMEFLGLGAGAAAPLLALVLFKSSWSPHSEIAVFLGGSAARLGDPTRWSTVAAAFWAELNPVSGWQRWGIVWPLALAGCVWTAASVTRCQPVRGALLLAFAGSLAACVFIYVAGPKELDWQLRTSLDRLLLQLLPLALICGLIGVGGRVRSEVVPPTRATGLRSPSR